MVVAEIGVERVVVRIIRCASEDVAFAVERALISCYRKVGHALTNLCSGGQGMVGHRHSEETKRKTSASMLRLGEANPAKRAESRAKISAKLSGDANPMKRTEVRAKAAAAIRDAWRDPALLARISGDNSPTKRADVRAKISAAMKGRGCGDDNVARRPEVIAKRSGDNHYLRRRAALARADEMGMQTV